MLMANLITQVFRNSSVCMLNYTFTRSNNVMQSLEFQIRLIGRNSNLCLLTNYRSLSKFN